VYIFYILLKFICQYITKVLKREVVTFTQMSYNCHRDPTMLNDAHRPKVIFYEQPFHFSYYHC